MNKHDATEVAYKNGYAQGKVDAANEIFEEIKNRLVEYFDGRNGEYMTTPIKTSRQLAIATAQYQGITSAVVFALNSVADIKEKYNGVVDMGKMTLEQAKELLEKEYEKAKQLDYVINPLAYALHQVWKTVDGRK